MISEKEKSLYGSMLPHLAVPYAILEKKGE